MLQPQRISNRTINSFVGWKKTHSFIAVVYILLVIIWVWIVFNVQAVHPIWFFIVFTICLFYFYILYYCSKHWLKHSDSIFEKKLFWYSLLFRVATAILLVVVAELTWGMPDYVGAVDARSYRSEALIVADLFRSFNFSEAYTTAVSFTGKVDNSGPPLFFGFIYALFGKHYLIGSFANAIMGSVAVVLLYKTGKIVWGNDIARTAGIFFMHFPLALIFSVVYLKEGVVVFLSLTIIYFVTKAVNGKTLSPINFLLLVTSMVMLFFFRTAVGAVFAVLVPTTFLVNRYKGSKIKSLLIIAAVIVFFVFFMFVLGEYHFYIDRITSAATVEEQRTASLGLGSVELLDMSIAEIAVLPVSLIMAVVAPFPAMVDVGTRFGTSHDHNYYFIPGLIVWNILVYYSVLGFYYSLKEKFFQSFMIWAFSVGYLYVLIATALFTRVRFAYISMPLMLILAAVGLYKTKNKIYWILYLLVVLVATVVWNYLRLDVRGFY